MHIGGGETAFQLDICGSVHHSTIHGKKIQQDATMYQNFSPYLYEAQHVSGDTPPTIRSLKLHWQPLVFHTWKVVRRMFGGRCQAQMCLTTSTDWNVRQLEPSGPLPGL
jgi:hypothetical protein